MGVVLRAQINCTQAAQVIVNSFFFAAERISYGDNGSVSVTFRLRKEPRRSHLFFGGAMQRVLKASAPLDERKLDAP